MGFFDFLKKKEKIAELANPRTTNVASINSSSLIVKGLTIHPDLTDLVWVADGKHKNYTQRQENNSSIDLNGIRITISFMNQEEPSLIYTNQKISQPRKIEEVERPPYFPTYSGLTPEQKWVYLNLLANPYNTSIDIGFVFILYYGLERHLLSGDFENAINVILKLRDVHSNKSFQAYSANAIVLSCMLHQRGDLVLRFIESLDKEHELAFSDNLFLMCYYSFDLQLLPKDIMRMSKTFEFNNTNYIKKYPDLFLECLESTIQDKEGVTAIDLKKYLTSSEIKKIKKQDVGIFANMSINDKSISIPLLHENFKLKRQIYNFLEIAHEDVKKKLAEKRKLGENIPIKNAPKKVKKQIIFDQKQENILLKELSKYKNDPVNKHFSYLNLHNFYYKYRSIGDEYISKCIEYCMLDIKLSSELAEAYVNEEINREKLLASYSGGNNKNIDIEKIRQQGLSLVYPSYKRLAIIYEKQKSYEKAIEICNSAIAQSLLIKEFKERKQKLQKKIEK